MPNGRTPCPVFLTLAGSASRTATGNGDTLDLTALAGITPAPGAPLSLLVQSDVTAVSGTSPSVTVLIQDSLDGVNWNTIGTFAAQTAVNRAVIQIAPSGVAQAAGFRWPFNARRVRATWTISGTATPSLTFSVKAQLL